MSDGGKASVPPGTETTDGATAAGGQRGEEAARALALHRADDETERAVEPDLAPARAGQALARAPRDGYSVEKPPASFELRAGKAGLADDLQRRADAKIRVARNREGNRAVLSLLLHSYVATPPPHGDKPAGCGNRAYLRAGENPQFSQPAPRYG